MVRNGHRLLSVAAIATLTGLAVYPLSAAAEGRMAGTTPVLGGAPVDIAPALDSETKGGEFVETVIYDVAGAMVDPASIAPAAGEEDVPTLIDVEAGAVDVPQILGGSDDVLSAPGPVESIMPAPAPEAPVVMDIPDIVPTPDQVLAAPSSPLPQASSGMASSVPQAASGDSAAPPVAPPQAPAAAETYYDSRANVRAAGPMSEQIGPRKVDPVYEPASRLVVSRRTHDQTDEEALVTAANRALALGRDEAAMDMFNQLYSKNRRDPRILMGRAVAHHRLGMYDVAISSYEDVLNIAPGNIEATVNLMGLLRREFPDVALRRLQDLRAKYPGNDMIAAQIGMVYADAGNIPDAVRSLSVAASINPRNATHLYNLAVISYRAGNRADALRYYQEALQVDAVHGGGKSVPRERIYDRLARLRQ